jgi:hypothetical protein
MADLASIHIRLGNLFSFLTSKRAQDAADPQASTEQYKKAADLRG